jgi:predicted phosphodiesterase
VPVAAISDIHGNLPALEAVLAEIEREGVDEIVVAGDTISGPWPAEVFDLLAERGARAVRGNADREGPVRAARRLERRPPGRASARRRAQLAPHAHAVGRRGRVGARVPFDTGL